MTFEQTVKKVVRSEDIYPHRTEEQIAEILRKKGYRISAFRIPLKGEEYAGAQAGVYVIRADYDDPAAGEPRFILEKLPKRKRYIFEETGEERPPRTGEYYTYTLATNGIKTEIPWKALDPFTVASKILTRREEEF